MSHCQRKGAATLKFGTFRCGGKNRNKHIPQIRYEYDQRLYVQYHHIAESLIRSSWISCINQIQHILQCSHSKPVIADEYFVARGA